MTDEYRKTLTEYIGECWHEWKHIVPKGRDKYYDYMKCKKCKETHSGLGVTIKAQRTFTTPADLHAVYSRMVEKGEWRAFGEVAYIKWLSTIKSAKGLTPHEFNAWLFCLNAPDQIPERLSMAAKFINERRK